MHSKLRDGSTAKLDLLLNVFKAIVHRAGGELPDRIVPKIREEVQPHHNPSAFRQKLDIERNSETETLSKRFYDTYEAGVFTAWRCKYDIGKGRPANPDALVGEAVGKRFIVGNSDALFSGAIVSYDPKRRWWRVAYDDGDAADYNFRELTKFEKPPDFSILRYEQTTACDQYLSEVTADAQVSDASPVLVKKCL